MTETVAEAKARRLEEALNKSIDAHINAKLAKVQLAAPISPKARVKLRDILKKYAKDPHPFKACVRDNMKRFGPGRTEAVCATLKDTIKGRKDWRKGASGVKASEGPALIDGEVLLAIDAISETDLQEIFMEARALEEYGNVEGVALLAISGREELARWGVDGEIGLSIAQSIEGAKA